MNAIGLSKSQIVVGKEVYYYSWKNKYSNAEPVKTKITSMVYEVSKQLTCFVEGVSGVVCISHLSYDYFPEKRISRSKMERKERYANYLHSESTLDFIDWLKAGNYKYY